MSYNKENHHCECQWISHSHYVYWISSSLNRLSPSESYWSSLNYTSMLVLIKLGWYLVWYCTLATLLISWNSSLFHVRNLIHQWMPNIWQNFWTKIFCMILVRKYCKKYSIKFPLEFLWNCSQYFKFLIYFMLHASGCL